MDVEAQSEAFDRPDEAAKDNDLERIFFDCYPVLVRAVSRVIQNPARAEELAVDAILRIPRARQLEASSELPWLLRTVVRLGLDELRRQKRFESLPKLLRWIGRGSAPDELFDLKLERDRVRIILTSLPKRDSELLVLRTAGLSYSELSVALRLKENSVGTMLSRAQKAFKKEYIRRFEHDESQ